MSTVVVITCVDCGYEATASTPALSAYAARRHSCDTHRERVARAKRRLDRLALSGPERPCQHGDRHQHGDRVRYVIDKCRCRRCRDANTAYNSGLERRRMYGRVIYVPAEPARAHVQALQAEGMGWHRIADHAGVSRSVLSKLLFGCPARNMGPSKRIRPATEGALLSVSLTLAGGAIVPGIGTRRRLQGLVAIGWSQAKLADRLGMSGGNFGKVIHSTGPVLVTTAEAVVSLYDQLWDQPTASPRAVRYAAAAGWVVPLAWDEDTIDDPWATPERGESNDRKRKVHLEDIEWLVDEGLTLEGVAFRLKANRETIEQVCHRASRRDLIRRMYNDGSREIA